MGHSKEEEETKPLYDPQEACEEEFNVPVECVLQEEEDGYQHEIDQAIARLSDTTHNPNQLTETKAAQQLFNQDPLRKVLDVALVEQEDRSHEMNQELVEEIHH